MEKKAFRHFSMRAAMLLLVMMLTTATAWAQSTETLGGYTFTIGTDGDGQYYKVDCEAALRALSSYSTSNSCSGKRFVQTADITLTGTFAPIGGNSSSNYDCFKGTYDGGGHTISGLQVEVTSSNFSSASAGLFSEVLKNGVVRNVGLIAPSVSCSCSGKGCRAGAIAGYVEYGTITNCFVLNPGTIMASNGSENNTGLFIGAKAGGTYANLYYYGTTALPMCGKNDLGSNHIERIYKVTAGSNAGLPTRAATEGFIAQGSHYYREGATVQLSYTGSNPNSYRPVYSVSPTNTGASVTEQGVLTMGNGDITITATLSNIPLINISTGTIADIADQAYTGSAIVPDITLTVGGKVLTAGSDYLVSCTNNVNVGTATLTATGQGNYTGTLTKNFRIYYADMTGSCGTNVTYTLHDEDQNGHYEQLIISGTGAMTDFNDPDDVPWAAYLDDITSVIVQNGVTHIGAFAFYLCRNLTSVSLSEGLTSIGLSAFQYCYRLSALTVPASVESVGSNSFVSLALSVSGGTLTFASGSRLTSVGNDAFYFAHASVDMSACTRLTAVPVAFQNFDKDVTFPHSLTSIAAKCFKGNNSKDAKVYVHVPDNYVLTVNDETIPATNGKADITSAIGVGTNHAAVTLSCTPDPAHFSVNGDGSYTIHTATGWSVFCDALQDNDTWNRFSGKTVKLGNDIGTAQNPITRMAGSSKHDFCGTFDGDGHTLTVNISSDDITDGSTQYVAPFRYVSTTKADPSDEADSPAAFRNLHVTGTITTDKQFTGGLIGGCWGTVSIENCRVSTAITSTISGDGTHGGIVGIQQNGALTITGCLFDGSLLGATTYAVGGFIGYRKGGAEIRNSLFAPAEVTVLNTSGATFARNKVDTYNSYYAYYLCDGTNYAPYDPADADHPDKYNNGHATRTVTAAADVTIEAVALTGDATEYTVSGITAYSGGGLQRGQTLYYGSGDQLSLTLSNSATGVPLGYRYDGYTASAGTLDGTTLTMPDADVTITVSTDHLASTGQPVAVAYVDADGTLHDGDDAVQAVALDGYETAIKEYGNYNVHLAAGTYYVGHDISYDYKIVPDGDITLILGNGKTMTLASDVTGIHRGTIDLTIYGQSLDPATAGTLRYDGTSSRGIYVGDYTQHSGNVTLICSNYNGVALEANTVTLNGGKLTITANSTNARAINASMTVTGGQLDATATGTNAVGIYTSYGDITLGWTNADDYIHVSSYKVNQSGTVKIADGQSLYNGSEVLSGTITDMSKLDGKTLMGVDVLQDAATNDVAALATRLDGKQTNVALSGRTLTKDGNWNTLCLPFSLTEEQIAASPLAGATIKEMAMTSNLDANGVLTLNFSTVTAIEAGTPYIIKWTTTGDNIVNPTFSGVTISSTTPTAVVSNDKKVTFVGQYSPFSIVESGATGSDEGNKNEILLMTKGNKIGYSKNPRTLKCFRCHFYVPTSSGEYFARNIEVDFGEGETTSLSEELRVKSEELTGSWYSLDGRKLEGKPTAKGMYIVNGRKVIIK